MSLEVQPRITRLPCNRRGRDFIVSAVNGQFDALSERLRAQGYEAGRDRLIAIGNLIGPEKTSMEALAWLTEQRLVSVLGQAEAAVLEWANSTLTGEALVRRIALHAATGKRWLLDASALELARFIIRLRELPLLIEVALPGGRKVGVVHGEVPLATSWSDLHASLEHDQVRLQVVYGHRRALALTRAHRDGRPAPELVTRVHGVDAVIAAGQMDLADTGNTHFLAPTKDSGPEVMLIDALLARRTAAHASSLDAREVTTLSPKVS